MFKFKQWLLNEMELMILPVRTMKRMGILDKLPEDHPTAKHGVYLNKDKFQIENPDFENTIMNGKFFKFGKIMPGFVDKKGEKHSPNFEVRKEIKVNNLSDLKKPGKKLIRVNMITNAPHSGMKWSLEDNTKLDKDYYQITSIAHGAIHYFCVNCIFKTPFCLSTYEKSEPRSKPTTYGKLKFGKVIGQINLLGRTRDLYDVIKII